MAFQEWRFCWTMWAIGWTYKDGRGWNYNELEIAFGPLRFTFLGQDEPTAELDHLD